MKIGLVPYEQIQAGANLIRLHYIKQYLKDYVISNSYSELCKCDVVVMYSRINDVELMKKLHLKGVKIVFDATDPHWDFVDYDPSRRSRDLFDEFMPYVDLVTVPTDELKFSFMEYRSDKIVRIIPDSVDLKTHNKQVAHTDKEEYILCWYGSYGNINSLELARTDLERLGTEYKLKLICLYDRGNGVEVEKFKNVDVVLREWSEQATIDTILESDLVINPRFTNWKSYKSNNKTIKAWALGVPCIEYNFYREIKKYLVSATRRNVEGNERLNQVIKEFSSKKSANY